MSNFPSENPVLVTCGLPYANGACHIGHLRTYIPADVFVRSLRKQKQDTVFVCGSDTHGTPIIVNAEEQGIAPKELIEKYHKHFEEIFKKLGIEFNIFGSTDSPSNHNRTIKIVNKLIDAGYVYPQMIELAYCMHCNRFLPDRYVEGICPHCGAHARGDECDQGCGRHLEPGEIREPVCKLCGNKAAYKKQEHFFFKLSIFKDFLVDYLDNLNGTKNAINYAKGWLKDLKDWCITRNMEWGVRFPDHDNLVVYVWVDAPIGYISFTEEWANLNGKDWKNYWKNNNSKIIHFIGGDIVYHHCIFWPAMLKGADYTLPWAVVASGMVKIEDKTFSKSRGYVVWVQDDYLDHGFHPDILRYYLTSYTSHTKELNFSWRVLQDKVNNELVGTLGNFLYRTLFFAHKYFGVIPEGELDKEILEKIQSTIDEVVNAMNEYEFKIAVDFAMSLASFGNTYFQSKEPWKLIKENKEECGRVIKNCLQIAKALTILFEPVLPSKMESAWKQLNMDSDIHAIPYSNAIAEIKSGVSLPKPKVLFEKIADEKIAEMESIQNARVKAADKKAISKKEVGNIISFEEFEKLDLRIGEIISAELIKKSNKLLKLLVDIGEANPRQIVAGIAQTHKPEELIGEQVVVLANLQPAKLFGVESNGMILAAGQKEAVLLKPEKKANVGERVR
ncbi:MAG TPA: methionine--tRNA ligase [Methanosarcinales archaeon]|nr:methionine--tRNA ligase [Methanosarcinales archaeon]